MYIRRNVQSRRNVSRAMQHQYILLGSEIVGETYPPRVVQFESSRCRWIVRLSSQESRQPPIAIHHCDSVSIVGGALRGVLSTLLQIC